MASEDPETTSREKVYYPLAGDQESKCNGPNKDPQIEREVCSLFSFSLQ
jgi:hypothetical protein